MSPYVPHRRESKIGGELPGFSVYDLLSPRLLSKNAKIKMYKTIIWPAVLMGEGELGRANNAEYGLRVITGGNSYLVIEGPKSFYEM